MATERIPWNMAIFVTATSPCTGKCVSSMSGFGTLGGIPHWQQWESTRTRAR